MEQKICEISFPNTVEEGMRSAYRVEGGYTIKNIQKNGECAKVGRFEVYTDGKKIAEIKESVCDIFFE